MTKTTIKAHDPYAPNLANGPACRDAYAALQAEFSITDALVQARPRANLVQAAAANGPGSDEDGTIFLDDGKVG